MKTFLQHLGEAVKACRTPVEKEYYKAYRHLHFCGKGGARYAKSASARGGDAAGNGDGGGGDGGGNGNGE